MEVRAARYMGRVVGAAWGAAEVGETGDKCVVQGLVVRLLGVANGPPASVLWAAEPSRRVVEPPTYVLGLTAWAHGRTASLCSTHGLTASCSQRPEPWWNVRHCQWCGDGSHTERVILQKTVVRV
jgi:hypothetical protein